MLEIKNMKKSFGDMEVLRGVDIKVEKGDVVTVIGPSGSGKTTLLRCINFLERAKEGDDIRRGPLSVECHRQEGHCRAA